MEEKDLEQRFRLLMQQVESAVSFCQETKRNLQAAIDSLRIEVETLRAYLEKRDPDLARTYAKLKDEILEKTDPEWPERPRRS
ncbi:MAG TPA: hypothetical protein VNL14_11465 [Candidatus Acidoferrales bacterium]|nr:hypothetical protein [Candidatus Acidoferrales bacterium]